NINSQVFSEKDVEICNSKFKFAVDKSLSEKPINEVIIEIGKSFLGTDYIAHTLEKEGDEQLVINLTGLDCTTFLETSLTLARCIKKGKTSFEDYQNELAFIRYRDGKLDQYPSRLHYFSDWIYNNQQKGIVKDITKEIGGKEINFKVNFMSENPKYYKQLKENPDFIPVISKQEKEINSRQYYYIPQEDIEKLESKIHSGDLIALTTSDKGLDIGHVGLAVKMDDGRIHFLHAPLSGSKVQITEMPLSDYTKKIKKHTGIIVLRVLEP
ncbi:MAG TPA: N-acetylmuramoyl-L-alanine amidase-like domain-containing protein, partial [Ignavibacteriaceae bacterium]